jgi:hypothetical protein
MTSAVVDDPSATCARTSPRGAFSYATNILPYWIDAVAARGSCTRDRAGRGVLGGLAMSSRRHVLTRSIVFSVRSQSQM